MSDYKDDAPSMHSARIERRGNTVYLVHESGTMSVLFHLAAANEYHLRNVDQVIGLAMAAIDHAPPAKSFFEREQ